MLKAPFRGLVSASVDRGSDDRASCACRFGQIRASESLIPRGAVCARRLMMIPASASADRACDDGGELRERIW